MATKKFFLIKNQGLAMLEAMVIVWVIFIVLGAFLGSWGIIHTATLNSIAARNFSFHLFNNRSEIDYLRDTRGLASGYSVNKRYYGNYGKRFSYVSSEEVSNARVPMATLRNPDFRNLNYTGDSHIIRGSSDHTDLARDSRRNSFEQRGKMIKKVGPAWIMVGYGICLDAGCGN